jgi:hypothetical protein
VSCRVPPSATEQQKTPAQLETEFRRRTSLNVKSLEDAVSAQENKARNPKPVAAAAPGLEYKKKEVVVVLLRCSYESFEVRLDQCV